MDLTDVDLLTGVDLFTDVDLLTGVDLLTAAWTFPLPLQMPLLTRSPTHALRSLEPTSIDEAGGADAVIIIIARHGQWARTSTCHDPRPREAARAWCLARGSLGAAAN